MVRCHANNSRIGPAFDRTHGHTCVAGNDNVALQPICWSWECPNFHCVVRGRNWKGIHTGKLNTSNVSSPTEQTCTRNHNFGSRLPCVWRHRIDLPFGNVGEELFPDRDGTAIGHNDNIPLFVGTKVCGLDRDEVAV